MNKPLKDLQIELEQDSGTVDWIFPDGQLSGDAAPNTIYTALLDNSWFRLLILEPSKDIWAPIQCQLRSFKRHNVHYKYEALSYAWKEGDPNLKYDWEVEKDKSK